MDCHPPKADLERITKDCSISKTCIHCSILFLQHKSVTQQVAIVAMLFAKKYCTKLHYYYDRPLCHTLVPEDFYWAYSSRHWKNKSYLFSGAAPPPAKDKSTSTSKLIDLQTRNPKLETSLNLFLHPNLNQHETCFLSQGRT